MWASSVQIEKIRGFNKRTSIEFSKGINLLVGQNNSGKSTILNTLLLQQFHSLTVTDITIGDNGGTVKVVLKDIDQIYETGHPGLSHTGVITNIFSKKGLIKSYTLNGTPHVRNFTFIPSIEPGNFIYPYLSKRKVSSFNETINSEAARSITGNFHNLYAKVDRLSNPQHPSYARYSKACIDILGFPITAVASAGGKRAVLLVSNFEEIPISAMGEGVTNLLGLIVDLCVAEKKLFVIEEPENDIHPKALKALLSLIDEKANNNQFIISTHSNIVTKYLGARESSSIFRVNMRFDESNPKMPVSSVEKIKNTREEKQKVLEELGYESFDYDLWKGWLFLEESSAEELIRDFFIPTYIPSLNKKLRTFSARGVEDVQMKFKDFNNLFVFIHLESIYKNKAWVILDDGENEKKIIDEMKQHYLKHGWSGSNFSQFSKHNFEQYYPDNFSNDVKGAFSKKGDSKREAKSELLRKVKKWIKDNPVEAKDKFKDSAKEVIQKLKEIEKVLA